MQFLDGNVEASLRRHERILKYKEAAELEVKRKEAKLEKTSAQLRALEDKLARLRLRLGQEQQHVSAAKRKASALQE